MTMHTAQRKTQGNFRKARLRFALQMVEQAQKVGGRMEELRVERGWSKAEMARRLPGVSDGNDVRRWTWSAADKRGASGIGIPPNGSPGAPTTKAPLRRTRPSRQ